MAEYIERDEAVRKALDACVKVVGHGISQIEAVDIADAMDSIPAADVVEVPQGGIGELSDGYHTFNELYHHRAVLFSVICNLMPHRAWKSKLHDTGDMYDGMFIVGIETPKGQATYHYDIDPYWDMFKVKELEKAPKWDGHTPQDAIERIATLTADVVEVRHETWDDNIIGFCNVCMGCGAIVERTAIKNKSGELNFCPNCGAKMDGKGDANE